MTNHQVTDHHRRPMKANLLLADALAIASSLAGLSSNVVNVESYDPDTGWKLVAVYAGAA